MGVHWAGFFDVHRVFGSREHWVRSSRWSHCPVQTVMGPVGCHNVGIGRSTTGCPVSVNSLLKREFLIKMWRLSSFDSWRFDSSFSLLKKVFSTNFQAGNGDRSSFGWTLLSKIQNISAAIIVDHERNCHHWSRYAASYRHRYRFVFAV